MEEYRQYLYRQDASRPSTKGLWALTFVVFTALYAGTAQREVSWQDSGEYQWRVLTHDFQGPQGLARAHPLYIAMGLAVNHLPGGNLEFKLNAWSGIGMAMALANLAAVLLLLTGRRWIALAGAAMVGVMHTIWWLSTVAEVYTWSVAGLTAEIWLLVLLMRAPHWKYLAGLALVSGMGWAIHNFALLPLPVYLVCAIVLLVRRRLPGWSLAVAVGAYLIGAAPFLYMIVRDLAATGDLPGTILSALVGRYGAQVLNVSSGSPYLAENLAMMALNFVSLVLPLAIVGFFRMARYAGRGPAIAIGAVTAIEIVFVARYNVPDQFTFVLPSLVMIGLAAGVGLAALADISSKWAIAAVAACLLSIALPPAFCAAAPGLAKAYGLQISREGHPRDELRYWFVPWKHNEHSAKTFVDKALAEARPDGVILANSTAEYALMVAAIEQKSDVAIQYHNRPLPLNSNDPAAIQAALEDRDLYVLGPAELPVSLRPHVELAKSPEEALYHVRWK